MVCVEMVCVKAISSQKKIMAQKINYNLIGNSVDVEEAKNIATIGLEKGKIFASKK